MNDRAAACEIKLLKADDPCLSDRRESFIDLYRAIFAEEPYYEVLDRTDVENRFTEFLNGMFFIALDSSRLVGFACATPLKFAEQDNPFIDYARRYQPDALSYWCIREWAVAKECRGKIYGDKKLSSLLLDHLLIALNKKPVVLETAADNNDRIIDIYRRKGFNVLDGLHRQVVEKRNTNGVVCERPLSLLYMTKHPNRIIQ